MQIIIDIPKRIYENCKKECEENDALIIDNYVYAIGTGVPLPKEKWIRKDRDEDGIWCECSNCGNWSLLDYDYTGFDDDPETWAMFDFDTVPLKNKNYCSNCGAKMEAEDEEEI